MIRKFLCLASLCLIVLPLIAQRPASPPIDKKIGHALLESIAIGFRDMAVSGSGGFEKVDRLVKTCMADAKKAKGQKQIDQIFFSRFTRLLAVIKLAMMPDPEGILGSVINQEIANFIRDTLGEEQKPRKESIGQLALAIGDELINLQLYLDNFEVKEKLWKSLEEKYAPQPEKKEPIKKDS